MNDSLTVIISSCPACQSKQTTPFFKPKEGSKNNIKDKHLFDMVGETFKTAQYDYCKDCGLLFLNPRWNDLGLKKLYGDEDIFRKSSFQLFLAKNKNQSKLMTYFEHGMSTEDKYYSFIGQRNSKNEDLVSVPHLRNAKWLKKILGKNQNIKIHDVGAGFGIAQKAFEITGFKYQGYEPSKLCTDYASKWDRNVINLPFQQLEDTLKKEPGIIYTNHFLEHVENPVECLKLFHKSLQDNQLIFISVPTSNYLSTNIAFLIKNPNFATMAMSWRHMSHFDEISLSNMMQLSGFKVLHWKNFDESIALIACKTNKTNLQLIKPNILKTFTNIFILPKIAKPIHFILYQLLQIIKQQTFYFLKKIPIVMKIKNMIKHTTQT